LSILHVPSFKVVLRVKIPVSRPVSLLYQSTHPGQSNPMQSTSGADPLRMSRVLECGMLSNGVEGFTQESEHGRRASFVVVFLASGTRMSFGLARVVMPTRALPRTDSVLVRTILSRPMRMTMTSCPGRVGIIDLDPGKQSSCLTFSRRHPLQYGGKGAT